MIHFEIAAILEILTIAGGFALLHMANKEAAVLLKSAAFIMIVGGIALSMSTIFFSIQGYRAGCHRGMMGPDMMGPGRWPMHPGMMPMRPGIPDPGSAPTGPVPSR